MKALSDGQTRNVMAFSICALKDFNEITYHFLDVVYAQLSLEKVSCCIYVPYFPIIRICLSRGFQGNH